MTFIPGKDGIVCQKDLGKKAAEIGGSLTEYDAGYGWRPALQCRAAAASREGKECESWIFLLHPWARRSRRKEILVRCKRNPLALVVLLLSTVPLFAQDVLVGPEGTQVATDKTPAAATNSDALRKAAQNPVASLISVPFQNNNNFNIGPHERTQDVLNIQPVIPIKLSNKWNLITRTILPIVWQPYPSASTGGEYGLGDLNPSFFLSPGKPGKLIWGVGPALVIPTATNTILGQGKFSIGPSIVLLTQPGHWTLGVLANNVWSVAGDGSRPAVNQFLLQYFIN